MLWSEANGSSLRDLRGEIADEDTSEGRRIIATRQLTDLLAEQPCFDHRVSLCVQAWQDLGTCRAIGMDVGPIPWTAIVQWCDFHGLDHDASEIMIYVIRMLDNEHAAREASRRALAGAGR